MELSRSDLALLSELISDSSTWVAAALGADITKVKKFLESLTPLIREINEQNGNIVFAIEVFKELDSEMKLTVRDIIDCRQMGRECIKVDLNNNFLPNSDILSADLIGISSYSADYEKVFLRVEGTMLQTIVNGVLRVKLDVFAPGASEPRLSKYARVGASYALLIKDHHRLQLPKVMEEYWHDRSSRILIANRQTEKFFQFSLLAWLDGNVADGRVRAEVRSISQERTDIEIQTFHGELYVIEVKWLGVNASNTKFDYERILEGMDQIYIYLGRDPLATKGILLCYDGRSEEEHKTKSNFDDSKKHMKGDYYILYLPSETASEIRR